jgi:hypothetical protein
VLIIRKNSATDPGFTLNLYTLKQYKELIYPAIEVLVFPDVFNQHRMKIKCLITYNRFFTKVIGLACIVILLSATKQKYRTRTTSGTKMCDKMKVT